MIDEVDPQILQGQIYNSTILDDFSLEGLPINTLEKNKSKSNHSLDTSDIHVWDHALSLNDMKQWTLCK